MPNATPVKVLLILLALIPIVVWGVAVYGWVLSVLYPARTAPFAVAHIGAAVLVLSPAFIGGISMIVGAALLGRKPMGARFAASFGAGTVALTVLVGFAGEAATADYAMWIAAVAYVLLHAGLIAWLWRGRRAAAL